MLDNALIALIISTIIDQETIAAIPGTPIKQAFQPQQQGVNTIPTAYLYKIGDKRFGYPQKIDVWDSESESMIHKEMQQYETTFQISTLATQNPSTPEAYTASDILNLIAYILQSSATIAILEAQGVGILRIADIRNPYFIDDRGRNEASPSMDFVLTHKQIVLSTNPIIQDTEFNIKII